MALQVSPGVNVSEIDLTTVVPTVSTTTGGIAGHFRWGPIFQPILISDENQLVQTFQTPSTNTYIDFFTSANFLNYGNQLFVVGVKDTTDSTGAQNATSNTNSKYTLIKNDDDYDANYSNGLSARGTFAAKYPGALGNSLKVSTCSGANAFESTVTANVTVTSNSTTVTFVSGSTAQVQVGDILLLGVDNEERKIATITNTSQIILSSAYEGNTSSGFGSAGTHRSAASQNPTRRWEYATFFKKAPGTSDYANTRGGSNDELHIVLLDEDGEITGSTGQILETYEGLSAGADAKGDDGRTIYYKDAINNRSQWIRWLRHIEGTSNFGSDVAGTTFGNPGSLPVTKSFTQGRDGPTPAASFYNTGFNEFNDKSKTDVSLLLGAGANQARALHLINNIAEVRKDCVVCLTPPESMVVGNDATVSKTMDAIIAFRNTLPSTSYAIMDSAYKLQYDRYNDKNRYIPLNGDTAGLIVRADITRDAWYSPAGFNRGQIKNVIKLSYNPVKAQRDQLYKKGVNPVVTFPGQGTVLFGDKTLLTQPSAFDRINVRRLFIVLEKAIELAANFTLFEFNDEFTRSQFKNLIEPFLRDVQGRRGITDFTVVCDGSNNTGEVIDRNEFVGDIYVKPNRSINYIQLNFVAVRTGVEFTEVVGKFG